MSKITVGVLAGLLGVGVGFAIGYVVVKQACKDRIVGGVETAVGKLGGGSMVQRLAGSVVRELIGSQ